MKSKVQQIYMFKYVTQKKKKLKDFYLYVLYDDNVE